MRHIIEAMLLLFALIFSIIMVIFMSEHASSVKYQHTFDKEDLSRRY